jgi:hypothetical protein
MMPLRSSEGQRVNWVNYNTGVKNLFFKMDADHQKVSIGIVFTHKDEGMQELMFEAFLETKSYLHGILGEEWDWQLLTVDKFGITTTKINTEKKGVSIFIKEDWPKIISFLKPRIIALDEYWNDVKDRFEVFR